MSKSNRDMVASRLVLKDWNGHQEDEDHAEVTCGFCGETHVGELFESPPDGFYVRYYCAKKARQGKTSFP